MDGTLVGYDGADGVDLEMISPSQQRPTTAGLADSSPNARGYRRAENKLLAEILSRRNVAISTISRRVEQLQLDQQQTVSTEDAAAYRLKTIASEIQDIQSQTGQKAQLAGAHVEEQSAQMGQLADAAKSQYGMSTATLQNSNALVEELRMRREAIHLLEEDNRT